MLYWWFFVFIFFSHRLPWFYGKMSFITVRECLVLTFTSVASALSFLFPGQMMGSLLLVVSGFVKPLWSEFAFLWLVMWNASLPCACGYCVLSLEEWLFKPSVHFLGWSFSVYHWVWGLFDMSWALTYQITNLQYCHPLCSLPPAPCAGDTQKPPVTVEPSLSCFHSCAPGITARDRSLRDTLQS